MASERPEEDRVVRDDEDENGGAPARGPGAGVDPTLSRNAAGIGDGGLLGAGTPANVDIHKLGEQDNPDLEWGDPEPGAVHSQTNTRRGVKTDAERGQGARTRQANKDQVSRRG
jgi:hypothetical protein